MQIHLAKFDADLEEVQQSMEKIVFEINRFCEHEDIQVFKKDLESISTRLSDVCALLSARRVIFGHEALSNMDRQ